MNSNFTFLPAAFKDLAEASRKAEAHIMGDPRAACFHYPQYAGHFARVIDQLTARGFMEPSALYEAPFNSIHAGGPEELFASNPNVIDDIFHALEETLPKVLAA